MLNPLISLKNLLRAKKRKLVFYIYDPLGAKLLIRPRIEFSHLNEHKLRHGFSDTINPIPACGTEVETAEHFLLRCQFCSTKRFRTY